MNIDKHFMNITDMLSDAMFTYGTDYTVRYAIITIQSIDYRKYLRFQKSNWFIIKQVCISFRILKEKTQNPIYYYLFGHIGGFSLGDVFGRSAKSLITRLGQTAIGFPPSDNLGMVSHADDLLYLFK